MGDSVHFFSPVPACNSVSNTSLRRKCRMMTSSNGNIFRLTGLLCGELTGHRWISRTKASDAELWYFLRSASEPTVEQTMETPVIWDAIALIMTSVQWWFWLICRRWLHRMLTKWQILLVQVVMEISSQWRHLHLGGCFFGMQNISHKASVGFSLALFCSDFRQTSNINRTLVGNKIVDVVGASPVGDAPTTSPFST